MKKDAVKKDKVYVSEVEGEVTIPNIVTESVVGIEGQITETLDKMVLEEKGEVLEKPAIKEVFETRIDVEGQMADALMRLGYTHDQVIGVKAYEKYGVFVLRDGTKVTTAIDFQDGSNAKPVKYVLMERAEQERIAALRRAANKNLGDDVEDRQLRWAERIKKNL